MATHTHSIFGDSRAAATTKPAPGRVNEGTTLPAPDPRLVHYAAPEAGHINTASRRSVLAALSGAALAGGALVLAMPTEAPATIVTMTKGGPDADLIALCAQHIVNLRAFNDSPAMDTIGYDYDDPLWDAYEATRDAISDAKPQTFAGLVAVAQAAMAEAGPDRQDPDDRLFHGMDEQWSWNLLCDLLRLHNAEAVS